MHPRTTLLLSAAGTIASVLLHYQRAIDWRLQEAFFLNGGWLIDENEPIKKLIFYRLPKAALILLGLGIVAKMGIAFYRRSPFRWGYVYLLATMALVPAAVSFAKATTNEACPKDILPFGGPINISNMAGECFPGGHASGGFGLFALYWVANRNPRWLWPGAIAGGLMGIYQMAKGAHFLSDTACSFFFALLLGELFSRMFDPESLKLI